VRKTNGGTHASHAPTHIKHMQAHRQVQTDRHSCQRQKAQKGARLRARLVGDGVYVYACDYLCVCVCVCTCVCMRMYVCVYAYVYVCVCVRVSMYVCVCV